MNHHARRLIDDRQTVIFIDNFQRDVFRKSLQRRQLHGAGDGDFFMATQPQRRLRRAAVHSDFVLLNKLLNPHPAHIAQLRNQPLIQPLARIFRRDVQGRT